MIRPLYFIWLNKTRVVHIRNEQDYSEFATNQIQIGQAALNWQ